MHRNADRQMFFKQAVEVLLDYKGDVHRKNSKVIHMAYIRATRSKIKKKSSIEHTWCHVQTRVGHFKSTENSDLCLKMMMTTST